MQKLFLLLIIGLSIFSACKKKEGCTDYTAINYDANAKEDDGSCEYANPFPDSADVYFFYATDTLIFIGDTLKKAVTCPTDSILLADGYHVKMALDGDLFDGNNEGQTFFSFSNPNGEVFNFYGYLQAGSDGDTKFQVTEITQVSPGINEVVGTSCIMDDYETEVAIISF